VVAAAMVVVLLTSQADAFARAMRAHKAACLLDDLDVVITIEVSTAGGRWGTARAAARAGPA
jgi:hypothetical protein